jgi:hypothetical protein
MLTACVTSEVRGMDLSPGEQLSVSLRDLTRGGPGSGLMRCLENVETPWRFYPLVNIQKTIEHGEIVDLAIAW